MICIYAIINIVDDKCYIGQASDKDYRWREHRKSLRGFYHHSVFLQRAWCKHGEGNFIFVILEILDDVSKLNEREAHWGKLLNPEYNMAPLGGSLKGYKHTDEARANMSNAHKGHKASDETRRKMAEARKGNQWNKGRKHSAEHIESRAKHHRGKTTSEETKAKMRAAQKGRTLTEEHKQKLRKPKRKRLTEFLN